MTTLSGSVGSVSGTRLDLGCWDALASCCWAAPFCSCQQLSWCGATETCLERSRTEQSPQVSRWEEMALVAAQKSPEGWFAKASQGNLSAVKKMLLLTSTVCTSSLADHQPVLPSILKPGIPGFPAALPMLDPKTTEVSANRLCSLQQTYSDRNSLKEVVVFILSGTEPYQRSRRWPTAGRSAA